MASGARFHRAIANLGMAVIRSLFCEGGLRRERLREDGGLVRARGTAALLRRPRARRRAPPPQGDGELDFGELVDVIGRNVRSDKPAGSRGDADAGWRKLLDLGKVATTTACPRQESSLRVRIPLFFTTASGCALDLGETATAVSPPRDDTPRFTTMSGCLLDLGNAVATTACLVPGVYTPR